MSTKQTPVKRALIMLEKQLQTTTATEKKLEIVTIAYLIRQQQLLAIALKEKNLLPDL